MSNPKIEGSYPMNFDFRLFGKLFRMRLSLPNEPCVLPQTIIGLKCRAFNSELSGIAGTMRNVVKREIESALHPNLTSGREA